MWPTIRACYDKRRKVMLETLERELPEGCTFTHPVGGLFAWVVLPEMWTPRSFR